MFKKLFVVLLLLTLPLSALAFSDVPTDHASFSAIEFLQKEGVVKNARSFNPDQPITTAAFLKMVLEANDFAEENVALVNPEFADVPVNSWFAPYVHELVRMDITPSYSQANFYPEKPLPRVQALKLFFEINGIGVPKAVDPNFSLQDVKNRAWFAPYVFKTLQLNLLPPADTERFGAFDLLTRGEAAELIYRYIYSQSQEQSVYQPADQGTLTIEVVSSNAYTSMIDEVWNFVKQNYLYSDQIDDSTLLYSAIKGMVNSLQDPYSEFMTPEENQVFNSSLGEDVVGIGAYVGKEGEDIVIVSPIKESPAEKAGLKANDIVLEVDDVSVIGLPLQEVVNLIRGEEGTQVKLKIRRSGNIMIFNVTRQTIDVRSVDYEIMDQRYLYVNIFQFGENAADEFAEAVDKVVDEDLRGMIIDVRNNPGGYVDAAVSIGSHFLKSGEDVTITVDRHDNETSYWANQDGQLQDLPVVVLTNEGSASAAEMLAGCLQDFGKATIVGKTTYGKGVAQMVTGFDDGSSLKLTIAKWLTPLRREIEKIGIKPDIEVDLTEDDKAAGRDPQLDRALLEIKKLN